MGGLPRHLVLLDPWKDREEVSRFFAWRNPAPLVGSATLSHVGMDKQLSVPSLVPALLRGSIDGIDQILVVLHALPRNVFRIAPGKTGDLGCSGVPADHVIEICGLFL